MSLKARIYAGFAIIVVLALANGTLGYVAVHRLNLETLSMQKTARTAATALKLDRDVHELKLRVNRYISTGHESSVESIIELNRTLEGRIRKTTLIVDEEPSDLLVEIAEHLAAFTARFDSVVEERRIREKLVKADLPRIADEIAVQLSGIGSSPVMNESSSASLFSLMECATNFSQAEKFFLRYFDDPDSMLVTQALNSLHLAINAAEALMADDQSAAELISKMKVFKKTAMRAVQATRSYLFLVNVVMAGESSEVSYYSSQLRKILEARQQQILNRVEQTTMNVNRITGISILTVIFLALLISIRLARSIVPPITKLTHTFERLANGLTDLSLSETTRGDEIGRMANAAMVFSDQNLRTRELLKESELLSQELGRKAEELQTTNADLDNFAYVASHDLKSPLRGIRQLAEWVCEDAGNLLPVEDLKHLEVMQGRVTKMELLLDDLLDYSRVGRLHADSELVDTEAVVKDLIDMIDNPRGIEIRLSGTFPEFETIRTPLEQVLLNLIGNAVKHHDKLNDGYVEIRCEPHADCCQFSVRDNGPGIDERHHERIFQIYQRVGDPAIEGSGMGLAIVKKQVEQFGGRIEVDSAIGQGSNFSFSWTKQHHITE